MFPIFELFGRKFSTYGVCSICGVIFAFILFAFIDRKKNQLNSIQKLNVPIVSAFGVFLGSHILYAITNFKTLWYIICNIDKVFVDFNTAVAYLSSVFGGMVFYGGLIGGLITGWIYCRHMKLDYWLYADVYAPCIPLFHAFGRIGCFLSGCCYGIENSWGFVYKNSLVSDANGVIRLPIQLFESLGDIIICILLVVLYLSKHKKGMVLYSYLLMYSILRFITEFFRGDEIRGFMLGLSTSQWISILMFLFSIVCSFNIFRKEKLNNAID